MKKKTTTRTHLRAHHAPHFYILFAAVMLVIGAFAALVATKVVGQTANNVIYACSQKQTGNLRMVAAGSICKPDEVGVSWSVQGPQGEEGPPGASISNGLPYFCNSCNLFPYGDKFKGKDFSNAQLVSDEFVGADLSGVVFKGAFLQGDDFTNTNLTGADLSNQAYDLIHAAPSGWTYNSSSVQFNGANLTNANFSNSQLVNFIFKGANLQGTNFSNDTISNSNFAGAQNTSTANITGVTWQSDTCPDGTKSNNNGNTCAGHF